MVVSTPVMVFFTLQRKNLVERKLHQPWLKDTSQRPVSVGLTLGKKQTRKERMCCISTDLNPKSAEVVLQPQIFEIHCYPTNCVHAEDGQPD